MTIKSKRILIETDRRETFILKVGGEPMRRLYCDGCLRESEMVDLDSAVTLSGRGARDLLREIDCGTLHSSQTVGGHLLVCFTSLRALGAEQGRGGGFLT